jgi:hypothetical protein
MTNRAVTGAMDMIIMMLTVMEVTSTSVAKMAMYLLPMLPVRTSGW